mmetsp:Transcript_43633/g.85248  ORF Transcript_43633/g.85248 Transcript_43633/m.85248 type:complete len:287 (-) Transcript_43633:208-1068(-)
MLRTSALLLAAALVAVLGPVPAASFGLASWPLSQQASRSLDGLAQGVAGRGGRGGPLSRGRAGAKMSAGSGDKTILWIRHGITEMNVYLMSKGYGSPGFVDPGYWDTKLTANGEKQARKLRDQRKKLGHLDLIVASPLSRALSTASIAFKDDPTPRIVNADLRERMWLSSDVGSPAKELKSRFGDEGWDFSEIEETWWHTDEGWGKDGKEDWRHAGTYLHPGEPEEEFKERLKRFISWVSKREEKTIAVVCHWGVIHALTGHSLDNCEVKKGLLSEMQKHHMVFVD